MSLRDMLYFLNHFGFLSKKWYDNWKVNVWLVSQFEPRIFSTAQEVSRQMRHGPGGLGRAEQDPFITDIDLSVKQRRFFFP